MLSDFPPAHRTHQGKAHAYHNEAIGIHAVPAIIGTPLSKVSGVRGDMKTRGGSVKAKSCQIKKNIWEVYAYIAVTTNLTVGDMS